MKDYIRLNSDEMIKKINLIVDLWKEFIANTIPEYIEECQRHNIDCTNLKKFNIDDVYYVNILALREVFERVHQREDYFTRYHAIEMSNYKEAGLIAFWITKLKPFHLKAECFDEIYDLKVNEEFALYYIFNTVSKYIKEQGNKYVVGKITPKLYNELLYTMQYRDLSKEAYGCIVELLAIATCKEVDA